MLTGDKKYENEFHVMWLEEKNVVRKLGRMKSILSTSQLDDFSSFSNAYEKFKLLPLKMIKLRSSVNLNQANYLLETEAMPMASEILIILNDMLENQKQLMQTVIKGSDDNMARNGLIALVIGFILSSSLFLF